MSRLIQPEHYNQLMLLRNNMAAQVLANDVEATQRSMGLVQGFLLGLYSANEIDFGDVQSLEDEAMQGITFLMNVRKIARSVGAAS